MSPNKRMRTPNNVFDIDPRGQRKLRLEESYKELSAVLLHNKVPSRVREIFETAKNLSLYACFVHDFHASACLTGFIALEISLKEKWRAVYNREPEECQMLAALLAHAVEQKWIRIESFSWARSNAAYNAKVNALNALYEKHPSGGFEPPIVDDAMIDRELESYGSWLNEWITAAKDLRNHHAHGIARPDLNQSQGPLIMVADAINGMF
ncbi:MAG TPA: hypothetical protein VK629_22080 [Steroidobacteraceae bacterium]|nr:hypothetical protein [Steroidobacteraceae bacterium]